MFGNSKYRINRLEECCKKLTALAEKHISAEQKNVNDMASIKKDIHSIASSFKDHDEKEDKKNKWTYDKFEELDKKINHATNKIYLATGGILVLAFFAKFLDLKVGMN